jgi:methionyl-tRNA formyltransferase
VEKINQKLRICFMGTPAFAVTSLAKIKEGRHHLVGVVTAPDKPAGRGRKINMSDVKQYALANDLPIYQPTNLKSEEFLHQLQEMKPDVIVVVAFRMLPRQVWSLPRLGTFNVHASLLPNYRGAAPIHWAIINGEETTGVTTFFLNEEIDTGEIILQKELSIGPNETLGDVYKKLEVLGADALEKTLELIASGKVTTVAQPENANSKLAPKLTKENTCIDWESSAKVLHNKIRGLSPFPVAWTRLEQLGESKIFKIYKASIFSNEIKSNVGCIIKDKNKLLVQAKDGVISIEELKIEGKRKMSAIDFLNGGQLDKNAHFTRA